MWIFLVSFPIPHSELHTRNQWAGEDLNLRRLSRQIYSLVRLATSLPTQETTKPSCGLQCSIFRLQFKTYNPEKLPGEGSNFK